MAVIEEGPVAGLLFICTVYLYCLSVLFICTVYLYLVCMLFIIIKFSKTIADTLRIT